MKQYMLPTIFGITVWFAATLFFALFGEHVLFAPNTASFTMSLITLIIGTAISLYLITRLYLLFNHKKNAALRFGIIGTCIVLVLDTFSLSNYTVIFPNLHDTQIIAFTAWMSFAYALFLIIPAVINLKYTKKDA
ncbi:DUF5367 family protein [Bacillus sp. JJ722]|uniref:DUF5367 family protein n=1 Tax=Bacillus sp. JJ722 TaxID=3122973 RepID=UPI0030006294